MGQKGQEVTPAVAVITVLLLCGGAYGLHRVVNGCSSSDSTAATASEQKWVSWEEAQKAPPPKPTHCVLRNGDSGSEIQLFEEEVDFEKFTKSAVAGDKYGLLEAVRSSGFRVAPGTRCILLDFGILGKSQFRITEGPNVGKAGWTYSEAYSKEAGE